MDYEILGVEDDDGPGAPMPPRRTGLLAGAVVGLAALVGAVVLFGSPGDWAGQAATEIGAAATPTPQPSPSDPSDPSDHSAEFRGWTITDSDPQAQGDPPRTGLSVGQICAPVLESAKALRVQFILVNSGATQVRVRDVRASLPLPGFVRLSTVSAGGTCTDPDREPVGRSLSPGEQVLVTMHFRLLTKCPQPAPVAVLVRARFGSGAASVQFPLFSDLGMVRIAGC